jgi:hypothetical protein
MRDGKKPTAWRIIDHGPDHAQYFPGHGLAFSGFADCATGCGSTPGEALEDALDSLAQDEWDTAEIEASDEARDCRASAGDVDDWHDCATDKELDSCEHYWYVSVDVR